MQIESFFKDSVGFFIRNVKYYTRPRVLFVRNLCVLGVRECVYSVMDWQSVQYVPLPFAF